MNLRLTSTVSLLLAAMLTLSACSDQTPAANATNTQASSAAQTESKNDRIFGQITAVSGNVLTLALAEQPAGAPDGAAPSDGQTPPDQPADGDTRPEMPNNTASDVQSGAPQGEAPQMQLTLTGETVDITVSDATTYQINGSDGALSDLAVDDIVTVEAQNDIAVSVTSGMGGGQHQPNDKTPSESPAE